MGMTQTATGGTQVRPDVVQFGDYVRFFGGNGFHQRLSDRWWKIVDVDTRFGSLEPSLRVIDANGYVDIVFVNRWISVVAHPYTAKRIREREGV